MIPPMSFFQGQSPTSLCGICLDSVIHSQIFKNGSCNHPFCTTCISKYVKVQRQENIVKVNCPDPECSVELKPKHLQSLLPTKIIVDWESSIYESSIPFNKKIYCPYNNCSVLLVNDGEENVTSCQCPSCHRLFCAQCKVPWHADMSCRKFQKLNKVSDDQQQLDMKFLELAKRKEWQKCPRCSMHVERTWGCNIMKCSTQFHVVLHPDRPIERLRLNTVKSNHYGSDSLNYDWTVRVQYNVKLCVFCTAGNPNPFLFRCGCKFCYKCGMDWMSRHTCIGFRVPTRVFMLGWLVGMSVLMAIAAR